MKNLIPDAVFDSVCDISADWLHKRGIAALVLDQDNTLARYSEAQPATDVLTWLEALRQNGFHAILVSNTRNISRVEAIAGALGVGYVADARKPSPDGFIEAARRLGVTPERCLAVGDQIFTDIWGAKRAGMQAAIVEPRGVGEHWFFWLRRAVETPFIRRAKSKKGE